MQCPLNAANKIAGVGKLRLGWLMAGLELLKARPFCFRYLKRGYV